MHARARMRSFVWGLQGGDLIEGKLYASCLETAFEFPLGTHPLFAT